MDPIVLYAGFVMLALLILAVAMLFSPSPRDPAGTQDEIAAEGMRLLAFLAPESSDRRVRLTAGPAT